jgi:DNA-binding CsgD family transcriptional regulator
MRGSSGGSDRLRALTGRERETLALLATGVTNGEIATALGIAEPTVKRHLANIYQKLGCTNRVQASNVYYWGHPRGGGR